MMMEMSGRALLSLGVILLAVTSVVDGDCEDGDIRYDPDNLDKLIIQVCADSQWGYVCGHESTFSKQDVAVACNQFGFKPDENSYVVASFDKRIDGFLSIRAIYCNGLENRLVDCPFHASYGSTATCRRSDNYFYYAAVNCTYEEIECINGEIQDGPNGVIEICVYGDWYPLCGDLDGWNHQDAETACRNLGQNPEGAKSLSLVIADYPEAYNLRFHCSGSESLLVDCPKSLITSCDENLLAVINCGDAVDDRPTQPSNIDFSIANSQLTVTWSGSSQYLYEVSCTINNINNTTVYYETMTGPGADTAMLSYILPNSQYNCCVISQFEEITSEPLCQVIDVDEDETTCLISSTVPSTTVTVSSTMSSNLNDFFENYSLSIYGFVAGLVVGVVIMMLMCGCVLIVCRIKHKRQKPYSVTGNFVSINSNVQELHHSNNPLYSSDRYNNNDYGQENLLKPTDEYAYIARRPPVPVPSEQITPYHTVVASELNHVDNRSKH